MIDRMDDEGMCAPGCLSHTKRIAEGEAMFLFFKIGKDDAVEELEGKELNFTGVVVDAVVVIDDPAGTVGRDRQTFDLFVGKTRARREDGHQVGIESLGNGVAVTDSGEVDGVDAFNPSVGAALVIAFQDQKYTIP